jgi:hypothetical protein
LGTNKLDQYSSVETSNKKWLENESDLENDEYELPILKYNANQDALVGHKEGTLKQEEEEPKTPLQFSSKEEEDLESEDEKSFGSYSRVTIDLWRRVKGGSPSYVKNHRNTHK